MLRNLVRVGRAAAKTVRGARTIDFARALSRSEPAAAPSAEDDVRGAEADRSHSPHSLGAPDGRNPFEVLRVTRSASARDIKTAYLELVKQYHPDRFQNESARAAAQKEFLNIQAAFHAISTRQHMPPYYEASPRHAQQPRAHEEAPVEHVYGIQGACIGVGTAFFFVLVWWWNSGVSDGTRQHDMMRMVKEESLSQERRARMLQAHQQARAGGEAQE